MQRNSKIRVRNMEDLNVSAFIEQQIQAVKEVLGENKAIVAVVFQVPNQPLFGDLTEDEIISLILHN